MFSCSRMCQCFQCWVLASNATFTGNEDDVRGIIAVEGTELLQLYKSDNFVGFLKFSTNQKAKYDIRI